MTLLTKNNSTFPILNHIYDDLFDTELNLWNHSPANFNRFLPKENIYELDDLFKVELSAPGLKKEDFKIDLDQNILTVSSEREEEKKEENAKYTKREFVFGSFQRSFNLPEIADNEQIVANYDQGILEITIPKKEISKSKAPKTIKIS